MEKLFWVGVIISCAVGLRFVLKDSINDWSENPMSERFLSKICNILDLKSFTAAVGILTHSLDVTELNYPSVTICKEKGLYDPGQYLRPIFNQFQFSCRDGDGSLNKTELLREHYQEYFRVDGGLNINQETQLQFWSSDSDEKSGISYSTYLFGLVFAWLAHL